MVIRCKFPVISYLFSVGEAGKRIHSMQGEDTLSVEPKKKKKIAIDKEKTRNTL